MACKNCINATPTCDPCVYCMPPGVTGLTTCEPKDPCEERPDIACVSYSGSDHSCINVSNGDTLLNVLLNILNVY